VIATLARLVLSLAAALAFVGHPATRIPPSVRTIDVRAPAGPVRVTDRAKVVRIVRWFDRLPPARQGLFLCPMLVRGPTITFVFRDAGGGVLARARYAANLPHRSLVSTECVPISLSVLGQRGRPLVGGRVLLRVQRLLGVRLL
jgi:hypothetical protein